jgi:Tol biopolymer transport system component
VTRRTSVNGEWSTPEPLTVINTLWYNDYSPDISSDGLTLYYDSYLAGRDLWVTSRADPNAAWQQPIHLGVPFNTASADTDPSISADGSLLYFVSDRPGGQGGFDIWVMPMKKQE